MKKLTKIIITSALLVSTLFLTSCGFAKSLKDQIQSTYDTWYKYTGNEGTMEIPLGSDANAEGQGSSINLSKAEIYVYYDSTNGLKLAVQSTNEQDIELVHGLAATSIKVTTGGVHNFEPSSFGSARWTVLITSGYFAEASEPLVSSDPSQCIILVGEEANEFKIQWRKVLANCILNLIGE